MSLLLRIAFWKFEFLMSPSFAKIHILSILFLAIRRNPRKFPASTAVPVLAFPSSYIKVPNVIGASLQENPQKSWSYVRSCKSEVIGIPPLRYGNNLFSADKSKAEALNSYFFSVFTQEKRPIPSKPTSPYRPISDMHISTHGVYKQLLQLNPRKA